MEPSGRKPWQPVAHGGNAKTDRAITKAERLERSDKTAALAAWARAERGLVDSAPFVALANLHTLGLVARHVTNVPYHPVLGVLLDQVRLR